VLEQHLWHLRRLPGSCRRLQDKPVARSQRRDDVVFNVVNG